MPKTADSEEYNGWTITVTDDAHPQSPFEWHISKGEEIIDDPTSWDNKEAALYWAKDAIDKLIAWRIKMTKIALTLSIVDGDSEDCLTLTLDKDEVKELFELISSKHWLREHTEHPEAEYARRLADTILGYANWSPNAIQEWFSYGDFCNTCGILLHYEEKTNCYRHGNEYVEELEFEHE